MGIQEGHENSYILKVLAFFVQVRTMDIHNFCVIFSSLMDHAANTKVVVSSDLFRLYSMWDSTVPIKDLKLSGMKNWLNRLHTFEQDILHSEDVCTFQYLA